jgi:nucleotide-binding universal stress UspA family protein
LELAIRWARRFDALVIGLGIVDEPHIRHGEAVPIGGAHYKSVRDKAKLDEAEQKVSQFLENFALRCANEQVAFTPLEDVGDPAARIELESQRYDLVLLGKETHFEFETASEPDDTLVQVLRHGCRPVVATPVRRPETRRVVIAYDGSVQAARALQAFEASGLARERDIYVVSVAQSRLEAAQIADRAVQFLSMHDVDARSIPLESPGLPADAILDQVERVDAELLVMGAFGRRTFQEFFVGTVTNHVLKRAAVPVFLYH